MGEAVVTAGSKKKILISIYRLNKSGKSKRKPKIRSPQLSSVTDPMGEAVVAAGSKKKNFLINIYYQIIKLNKMK
jgi:hypothetical protein